MIAIGIDPGMTGAIAAVCQRRGLLDVADMPTCRNGLEKGGSLKWVDDLELWTLLAEWASKFEFAMEHVTAYIERPIPMPGQQVWTTASSFDSQGALRSVCRLRGYGPTMISPYEWKKFYGLGKDKGGSLRVSKNLYPSAPITLKKHHGRAEAVLIAHYGLRMES